MAEIKFKGREPVPSSILIGVAGDDNSERVWFSFDSKLSGNLSLKLESGDYCDKIPLEYKDNIALWKPSKSVLSHSGRILGQLQTEDDDGGIWQTYQFSMNISAAIDVDAGIDEIYPSILAEIQQKITRLEKFGTGEQGEKGDSGDTNCYTRAEADERFVPISIGGAYSFVIPVGAWVQSGHAEYPLKADVAVAGISGDDLVRADFDMTSWKLAIEAQVPGAGNTSANKMTFYAKYVPDGVIGGFYTIHKAVA